MRRVLSLVPLLLLLPGLLPAQPRTWPPGGITPAPFFMLPEGRILPSTLRWNLVWADQIPPGWTSDSQMAFAARNYIGARKLFANSTVLFRALNPNFLVGGYHLAAGLNPARNNAAPDPKDLDTGFIGVVAPEGYVSEYNSYFLPWLAQHGITVGGARYEAMFQHYDADDSLHRVWHQAPFWLMNVANEDWTNYVIATLRTWIEQNLNDACFFDVAVEMNASSYNPNATNPSPRNFEWWQAPHGPSDAVGSLGDRAAFSAWQNDRWRRYFQKIYPTFHTAVDDRLVIPNVDQMVTTLYDPVWLDGNDSGETVDGAIVDGFGGYSGLDMWETLERTMRHITARNKVFIAQFSAPSSQERLRRVAMYMLIKNEMSYLNIANGPGVQWYPEYEIDLGNQLPLPSSFDSMRVKGSTWRSLWRRDFERGIVLVNTSTAGINFTLPEGEWQRIGTAGGGGIGSDGFVPPQEIVGTPVEGTVRVPESDGMILVRLDTPSSAPHILRTPRELNLTSLRPAPSPR